jgi:ATP-dependent DNA helicase RecG
MASEKLSDNAKTRLNTMVATNDGFEIAEVDLKLRGPGNLMGTQQSGVLNLKIADIIRDNDILKATRFTAKDLLKEDPNLKLEKNRLIRNTYKEIEKRTGVWSNIS